MVVWVIAQPKSGQQPRPRGAGRVSPLGLSLVRWGDQRILRSYCDSVYPRHNGARHFPRMHPGYCPQCGERVTPFAAGCALCGADLDPRRWQRPPSVSGTCTRRNVADVSAVADPLTGVAIYDSSLFGSFGGWAIFGGTSVSAPIIAGMNALAANTAKGQGAQLLYAAPQWAFLPVTSGSNGTCSPQYLCPAMTGYNGPTGLGIPQGLGGF